MKKFKDELNNGLVSIGQNIITKEYAYGKDALINCFEYWVSPEDHQAEVEKRKQQYEDHQEIYSKTAKKLNEAELELSKLKSQLEKQQPEIPEFVAKAVEEFKKQPDSYKGFLNDNKVCTWLNEYQMNNDDFGICGLNNKFFVLAHFAINGYTVAKEKRFYLKHELTGQFLAKRNQKSEHQKYFFWTGENPLTHSIGTAWELKFTQQEIDSMETGSYEQIEVEE